LAKVEAHLGELAAAAGSAQEALTALTASHGPRAAVVREVRVVLENTVVRRCRLTQSTPH
jgi:hypothetical protein